MTVPRWLVPVLSVVAAVAIGVAATLLGMSFAPPQTVATAPESQIVPVLAPIATGDEPPVEAAEDQDPSIGDEGTGLDVSDAVAEREVAVPVSEEADEATFLYLAGLLGGWPDALLGLIDFRGDDRTDGDDPCSPGTGEPPADCPEGLRGAIFSSTALRDFSAGGQAYPPTYEEFLEEGNPYGGSLWCDGLAPGEGEVPFGILATAPGRFTVEYWPTADPSDVQRARVVSSAEHEAAWDEQVALGDEGFPVVHECLTLPGIRPGAAYTAFVTGTDVLGRVAPGHTTRFHADGEPVRPGLQLATVGDNLLFASALAPDDETVEIRAVVVEGEVAPSCDAAGSGSYHPLTQTTVRVDADEIAAVNAPPGFRNKTVLTFAIPEGATAIVCARWFPDGEAPSWISAQHVFESAAVVQAPDRLGPRLALTHVNRYGDQLSEIRFTVSTAEGALCWSDTWRPGSDVALPWLMCSPRSLATGGTTVDDRDRLSTRGFSGELVIKAEARLTTGEASTTSYLIPAGDGACRGVCETPERQWFRIALADVEQVTGLCGSFFGSDCEAPTTAVSAGTATFSLDWEQGGRNGRADWFVSATEDRPVEYVVPDEAQIDLDTPEGGWTFTDPTLALPLSDATLTLDVDRPVSYRLTLTDVWAESAELGVPTPGCRAGVPLQVTGSTTATGARNLLRAYVPGLCLGERYSAYLELTDEAGRTTVWSDDGRVGTWWRGATVSAPRLLVDLVYDFRAQSHPRSFLYNFDIRVNGAPLNAVDTRSGSCLSDGITESHGRVDGWPVVVSNQATVDLRITASARWGDAEAWDAECLASPGEEPRVAVTFDFELADLMNPYGVVLRAPESYGLELVLHGYNPRAEER